MYFSKTTELQPGGWLPEVRVTPDGHVQVDPQSPVQLSSSGQVCKSRGRKEQEGLETTLEFPFTRENSLVCSDVNEKPLCIYCV